MAKPQRLLDLYRFPGFVPRAKIRGLPGDPGAVVLTLRRRRKKRAAVSVGERPAPITTSDLAASATSAVATSASIWMCRSAVSGARGAAA
jgi:hypothetical protein